MTVMRHAFAVCVVEQSIKKSARYLFKREAKTP